MRLRNLIPTEAKLHLFKSAILPHLTYCHLVWHFCRASDTHRLERVQERGLRAVFKDKQCSDQQLLVKAKLPSCRRPSCRRLQDICILMYEVKHNLCPRTICDMFLTNNHTYNYGRKIFINLVLTQLRTENTQFDTQVQNFGARYQARTDQLPVFHSYAKIMHVE